jgi:hypothetical protein
MMMKSWMAILAVTLTLTLTSAPTAVVAQYSGRLPFCPTTFECPDYFYLVSPAVQCRTDECTVDECCQGQTRPVLQPPLSDSDSGPLEGGSGSTDTSDRYTCTRFFASGRTCGGGTEKPAELQLPCLDSRKTPVLCGFMHCCDVGSACVRMCAAI